MAVGYQRSRGAVRPPFIEAYSWRLASVSAAWSRGAVRPPFIEALVCNTFKLGIVHVSGGSPPPLH